MAINRDSVVFKETEQLKRQLENWCPVQYLHTQTQNSLAGRGVSTEITPSEYGIQGLIVEVLSVAMNCNTNSVSQGLLASVNFHICQLLLVP